MVYFATIFSGKIADMNYNDKIYFIRDVCHFVPAAFIRPLRSIVVCPQEIV